MEDSVSEDTNWTVKLTSGGTAKHIEYVSVREFDTVVAQTYNEPGVYRGTLSRVGLGTLLQDLPVDTIPLKVDVEAWVTTSVIEFYDATKNHQPIRLAASRYCCRSLADLARNPRSRFSKSSRCTNRQRSHSRCNNRTYLRGEHWVS